jgi:hypothetical protein
VIEADLQHDGLEIAARDRVSVFLEVSQECRERPAARTAWVGIEDAKDGTQVEQLRLLGPLDGAAEVVGRDDRGQVEQRAWERRRRNAAFDGQLVPREVTGAMEEQPRTLLRSSPAGQRELDECAAPRSDAPQGGRASMAHRGLVAVVENDTQHVPLAPQLDMAEGVDATLDWHQASSGDPVMDRILPEPETEQLPSRYHSVLATRQRMDVRLDRT